MHHVSSAPFLYRFHVTKLLPYIIFSCFSHIFNELKLNSTLFYVFSLYCAWIRVYYPLYAYTWLSRTIFLIFVLAPLIVLSSVVQTDIQTDTHSFLYI